MTIYYQNIELLPDHLFDKTPATASHTLLRATYLGTPIVVAHNGLGHRTGYIKPPLTHPWARASNSSSFFDSEIEPNPICHGGITYSRDGWIGFDCVHYTDARDPDLPLDNPEAPIHKEFTFAASEKAIRSTEYVLSECCFLVDQITQSAELQAVCRWNDHRNDQPQTTIPAHIAASEYNQSPYQHRRYLESKHSQLIRIFSKSPQI